MLAKPFLTIGEQVELLSKRGVETNTAELSGLTGILGRRAKKSESDFVSHYRREDGLAPIWVLANDLTFGNRPSATPKLGQEFGQPFGQKEKQLREHTL